MFKRKNKSKVETTKEVPLTDQELDRIIQNNKNRKKLSLKALGIKIFIKDSTKKNTP